MKLGKQPQRLDLQWTEAAEVAQGRDRVTGAYQIGQVGEHVDLIFQFNNVVFYAFLFRGILQVCREEAGVCFPLPF